MISLQEYSEATAAGECWCLCLDVSMSWGLTWGLGGL